jgi:hypothetical protein
MNKVALLAVLLLVAPGFAAVIESGDNGEQFAIDTANAQCNGENVQAVYHCLGNIVRVVSSVEGEGSTFYKPDGRVIRCPVVPPSQMGAECLQMMTPNYCPTEAECGNAPVPQVFPGQNDTPEQTGDEDYYIIKGEEVVQQEQPVPEVIPEPAPKPTTTPTTPKLENKEEKIPAATENKVDNLLSDLTVVILVLGVVSVGVLFMLFKKSINE